MGVVRLRLARFGRKNLPFYRIFVADSRSPRDGKHLEVVGHYNPLPGETFFCVLAFFDLTISDFDANWAMLAAAFIILASLGFLCAFTGDPCSLIEILVGILFAMRGCRLVSFFFSLRCRAEL